MTSRTAHPPAKTAATPAPTADASPNASQDASTAPPSLAEAPAKPPVYRPGTSWRAACDDSSRYHTLNLPNSPAPLSIHMPWGRGFTGGDATGEPLWWLGPAEQALAAAFSLGEGRVLLLASLSPWNNEGLVCGDHAYWLAQSTGSGTQVVWILNQDAPALWRQLWDFAPQALLALGLALLAWLWHGAVRFGSTQGLEDQRAKPFLMHLQAWAQWLWQAPLAQRQVAQLRKDTFTLAQKRLPGLSRATPDQQIQQLSQMTGLAPDTVQQALLTPYQHSAQQLTQTLWALQTLRNQL